MQEECKQSNNCTIPEPFIKLWCLTYKVKEEFTYEGMAVVSAEDVRSAIEIFKKSSMHNGTPDKIVIGRIDQIPYPAVPKLVMENYVKTFDNP